MKIQYKASFIMTVFGVVIVLLLSGGYDILNHQTIINKELKNIKNISHEIALHLDSRLKEFALAGVTLSSAPIIKNALLASNSELAILAEKQRKFKIDKLNQQWKNTNDINDPFIQNYINNPVADFLHEQQRIMPKRYGEIFLTNRYGAMIATTGKLTTLAHAHKYWWQASFDDGKGRVFLDDRGFDTSVDGYVLGIVIPIKDNNEIIGILKCNVNIMGPLTEVVRDFSLRHYGQLQIARTGGLIVFEHDITPLSTQVSRAVANLLQKKENAFAIYLKNNRKQLTAFSSIPITMGSAKFAFGGSQESIDHIKGNTGEGWHIVVSISEQAAIAENHGTTATIILVGVIFTLLTAMIALLLGKLAARPIVELANVAQVLGEGQLDRRAQVNSSDEIGSLAKSLNRMANNIHDTIVSRDALFNEVKQRTIELEQAKKNAEAANYAKGIFIANMSHEFRTPLIAVLGFSEEMLEDNSLSNKNKEYLKSINRSGRLQLELINDVLAMSNLDGINSLDAQKVDLMLMIDEIIDRIREQAKAKKIDFNIALISELPRYIRIDQEKLQQSLNRVIDNAIKFTETGQVKLSLSSQPANNKDSVIVNFDVQDSGSGIPPEFQQHIFQPFVQLSDNNDNMGTGLGLTLVQRYLELMGGEISLESELGKGTIFHISLPVQLITDEYFGLNELTQATQESIKQAASSQDEDLQLMSRELSLLDAGVLAELADAVFLLDIDHALEIAADIEINTPELGNALATRINNLDLKVLQGLLKSHHRQSMS